MNKKAIILLVVVVIIGLAQLIRPAAVENYNEDVETPDLAGVPLEVSNIIRNSCFNCHSSTPNLSWYDKITPANFLVASHIEKGKKLLNFTDWEDLPPAKRKGILYYSINKILSGEMPLASYTLVHPAAKINDQQMQIIKNYLVSVSIRIKTDSAEIKMAEQLFNNRFKDSVQNKDYSWVKAAPNGIAYIPDYRNWKAISTTDRFDNGTMRIIFGNDIAVKAIQEKNTNPWPDGTVFAKTAWKQEVAADGRVTTGQFVQVEYMIKDVQKYADTKGWGWARWKGVDLRPYGKTVKFATECVSCHAPVKNNDYVFTTPLNLK